MFRLIIISAVIAMLAFPASEAAAQAGSAEQPTVSAPSEVVVQTPTEQPVTMDEVLEFKLKEASDRSRRVRIALISTTGAFVVGMILAAAWAGSNCDSSNNVSVCNNDKQQGLSGTGAFFLGAGAIGMITTGIMLGVRNKRWRDLERQAHKRRQANLHWDTESGLLRF